MCTQTHQYEGIEVTCKFAHQGLTVGFYGNNPIVKPSAITVADNTSLGLLFAVTERDVIVNMRVRINELETRLKSLGLLS